MLFIQGRLDAPQGGDALDGTDDGRGQAEGRKGARDARPGGGLKTGFTNRTDSAAIAPLKSAELAETRRSSEEE